MLHGAFGRAIYVGLWAIESSYSYVDFYVGKVESHAESIPKFRRAQRDAERPRNG